MIEDAFPYSLANKDTIPADQSLYDYLVKKASEIEMDPNDRQLLLDMSQMWGCYIGDAIDRQSLRFAFLEDCCGGGMNLGFMTSQMLIRYTEESVVASTFADILKKLAAPALASANILLKTLVVGIENLPSSPPTVSIKTEDGKEYQFDAAVVTTPLGWLKRNLHVFDPPIPGSLTKAISTISVGHLEKVYLTFPRAFWRTPSTSTSTSTSTPDPYPGYTNWTSPSYAPSTNPHAWPQEAYDLSAFAPPHAHPTLLFYTFGAASAHISGAIHGQPPATQHAFLAAFFAPYVARLPGFADGDPACVPVASLATAWRFDDLAGGGSYCNFQVGLEDADVGLEALRTGCPDRRVWFAGEHVAPVEEMGTVTGAYLSGEGAARRVVAALGGGEEV